MLLILDFIETILIIIALCGTVALGVALHISYKDYNETLDNIFENDVVVYEGKKYLIKELD